MSFVSVLDEFTNDLLDTLKLKPWWEIWREYAYKGSLAVIALFAFSPRTQFKCLHYSDVDTNNHLNMSAVEASVVNSYCKSTTTTFLITNGDLIAFGMSAITYICANYWVHKGGIKDRLTDISEFGRSMMELKLTLEEMKKCTVHPIQTSSEKKHVILRRNVQILVQLRRRSTLWNQYLNRCFVLCIWTGIFSVLSFLQYFMIIRRSQVVNCNMSNNIIQLQSPNSTNTFKCVDDASNSYALLEFVFGVTVSFQFISMLTIYWKMQKPNIARNREKSGPPDPKKNPNQNPDPNPNLNPNPNPNPNSNPNPNANQNPNQNPKPNPNSNRAESQLTSRDECIAQMFRLFNCGGRKIHDHYDVPHFLILMMGIDSHQAKIIEEFSNFVLNFKDDEFQEQLLSYSEAAIVAGDVEHVRILKDRMTPIDIWSRIGEKAGYVLRQGDNDVEIKNEKEEGDDACDWDYKVYLFLHNMSELTLASIDNEDSFIVKSDVDIHHLLDELPSELNEVPDVDAQSRPLQERSSAFHEILDMGPQSCLLNERSPKPNEILDVNPQPRPFNERQSKPIEKRFAASLMMLGDWHLLSCCPPIYRNPKIVADMNFDYLDPTGRSYLFYVLRKSSMDKLSTRFNHFNGLMEHSMNKREKLVHFDGTSMKVENFFHFQYPGIFRGEIPHFRLCDGDEIDKTNGCMLQILAAYKTYHTNDVVGIKKTDQKLITHLLNRIKLAELAVSKQTAHGGDNVIEKIVEIALKHKHWEVLVALINTYIVVHIDGKRPDTHGLIRNDIFHLQSRLTNPSDIGEIFMEALKRPRDRMYFVPTAAEHILSISDRDQRDAMIPYIAEASLPEDEKNRLTQLARTYNENNI